jgi:hypothetical protein
MQLTGFEDAQLRNEEAVKRHFCLSCVAQSMLQISIRLSSFDLPSICQLFLAL